MTTTLDEAPVTAIPDLRDIPLSALPSLPSGLAEAIRLYRERTGQDGVPAKAFNSNI